jgi:tripartite-type tricarboxylate transporter receptor subunit TctC
MLTHLVTRIACAALFAASASTPALAQTSDILAGKTVQMIIGFGPGGGYDLWGRTVARHIGRHLPGRPNVVPHNMPGAGSFVATSHIYNAAPKDGTVLGIIARDAALGPLTGATGARFDATRLSWIGSPTRETNVCIAYHTAQVKTAQDLLTRQLIVGDTGPGTGTRAYPKALNELVGTRFKVVGGFPSSAEVFLAMERGEVDGICESLDSVKNRRPDWIPKQTVPCCCRAAPSQTPSSRACPSSSTSPATRKRSRRSRSSMPDKASGARSSPRRIFLPTASRCCATRSMRP